MCLRAVFADKTKEKGTEKLHVAGGRGAGKEAD
jgi:hypothetical protein